MCTHGRGAVRETFILIPPTGVSTIAQRWRSRKDQWSPSRVHTVARPWRNQDASAAAAPRLCSSCSFPVAAESKGARARDVSPIASKSSIWVRSCSGSTTRARWTPICSADPRRRGGPPGHQRPRFYPLTRPSPCHGGGQWNIPANLYRQRPAVRRGRGARSLPRVEAWDLPLAEVVALHRA